MKKKSLIPLLFLPLSLFAATLLIYWFNLDNKAIYFGVRPLMNRMYDAQKRHAAL